MLRGCGPVVDSLCEICVKFSCFYTAFVFNGSGVGKTRILPTIFERFLHGVFHSEKMFFQSVNRSVLPTFNIVNKNNNNKVLNINYYWRVSE